MAQTLGKQLAQERERSGLSIQDVAHRTRIPANVVRSLENDDYSHFPNLVYARSFLRMYSTHLDVDSASFLDELRQAEETKPARSARSGPVYFKSQVTRAEVDELTRVQWNFDWFPWRTILSTLFFASVLGAGSYVVYELWNEHNQETVNGDDSSGSGTGEESLIGGGGEPREPVSEPDGSEPGIPEGTDDGSGSDPLTGAESDDDEIVLRAMPVDPKPAPAPEGETPAEGADGTPAPNEDGPTPAVGLEVRTEANPAGPDTASVSPTPGGSSTTPTVAFPPSSRNTN